MRESLKWGIVAIISLQTYLSKKVLGWILQESEGEHEIERISEFEEVLVKHSKVSELPQKIRPKN